MLRFSAALVALMLALGTGVFVQQVDPDAPPADCGISSFDQRACFTVDVELLRRPELGLIGFYEPPRTGVRLAEQVYRHMLGDDTPFTCERIGGFAALQAQPPPFVLGYIVTPREAFRSRLSPREMARFVNDPFNLVLITAEEAARRGDADPKTYLPARNTCWYVWRYLLVKQRWLLTVDQREVEVLDRVFQGCLSERFTRVNCLDAYAAEDAADHARAGY